MKISTIVDSKEKRVAITPETAKKYSEIGLEVTLPRDYGITAMFNDSDYIAAGAKIEKTKNIPEADLYVAVKPSLAKEIKLKRGSYLIALLSPSHNKEILEKLIAAGVHPCALEKIPRITRAQSMDVLSSQANISGYRAMLEALYHYARIVPMMMTAAGTVRPAKVLVVGAGIAGLQAIATAKRLGAIVYAFDVRIAAKEQVESLGGTFISVEDEKNGETAGGYAQEMSDDYKKRQMEKLAQMIAKMDIVITTAQIPEKQAPLLVTKEMVASMPPGAIVLDMATETGGNCELSKRDETLIVGNVTIIGHTDFAARVANDSSQLFARNVFNFVSLMIKDGKIDLTDEIIQAVLI
ncbi:MAG: Re/Si-specific NAD(P)(+) transhydrogenase subunit alpha [Holosporaceae bacterium]|jgi:NAD(P) transhydrogenase subunit alpha|nr:Re/Si-specific NAD(P)(+) transhydrogenase subunit alpha [Holosporaceae bacterium]